MIHFADLSWAQSILIEIGVGFQLVAICLVIRDTFDHRDLRHTKGKGMHHDERHLESLSSNPIVPVRSNPKRDESHDDHPRNDLKTANITRTSKVRFKQTFKFRE
jgi:hypothetical protein